MICTKGSEREPLVLTSDLPEADAPKINHAASLRETVRYHRHMIRHAEPPVVPPRILALEARLKDYWQHCLITMNAANPRYGSWIPGRRNHPPSMRAEREFRQRKLDICEAWMAPRDGQLLHLLQKIARCNGGTLTAAAESVWRTRWQLAGRPIPLFHVTRNAKPTITMPHLKRNAKPTITMPHLKLTDRITDILRRSTITANLLVLPEQLARPDYELVNKTLKNAGGKWKRGTGHVFPDGTQFITDAISSGVSTDRDKQHQFYPTPDPLASDLVAYGHIQQGHRVLEPSAGHGALIRQILKYEPSEIVAVETRDEAIPKLKALLPPEAGILHQVIQKDFLELTPGDLGLFDAVIMNPPFARDQDLAHIQHAYSFVKPGGRLVALSAPGWTYSLNRKRAAFAGFIQKIKGDYTRLAAMEFGKATIAPILLMLDKPELSVVESALARLMAV